MIRSIQMEFSKKESNSLSIIYIITILLLEMACQKSKFIGNDSSLILKRPFVNKNNGKFCDIASPIILLSAM